MSKTDFYQLGRHYASRPVDEYQFDDAPAMSYEERIEFNRGFDDAMKGSRVASMLFVSGLVVIVLAALFSLVN